MTILRIYFLGSTHEAKNYTENGKGNPYDSNENVYLREWKGKNGEKKIRFVFSGPDSFNAIRTIKSIKKEALDIVPKYINENNLYGNTEELKIEISGHSRGGLIAQRVYDKLKSTYEKAKFIIKKYDEYAGPFKRLKKGNDSHNIGVRKNKNLDSSVFVVSLHPTVPFNSIAKNKNAKYTVFTTCSHGSTGAVGRVFDKISDKSSRIFYHISDFHFDKKKNAKAQIASMDKSDYIAITKENVLEKSKELAKRLKCKIKDGDDINKIVNAICKKISSRRGKIFKGTLKKFKLLG